MEERNIRWGELVGGLLFVGGSIALVKTGAGTWTLSNGGNSYSGATDVLAGTLKVSGAPIFSSNATKTTTTIAAGATLDNISLSQISAVR